MRFLVESRLVLPYSLNALYHAVGISKQAYHQRLKHSQSIVSRLKTLERLLLEIREDHPVMALRTIHSKLQNPGIGRDLFEAYFMSIGYGVERRINYQKTTDSRGVIKFENKVSGLVLHRINQVWVSDITYFSISGKFYYITFIMDAFSRKIIGCKASKRLFTESSTLPALRMAINDRKITKESGKNLIFHSDGGGQYYDKEFIAALSKKSIESSMAETVYENAMAERINGVIKNNYLVHWKIDSFEKLEKMLDRAVKLYNSEKPHKSLGQLTPEEFERKCFYFALEQKTEGDKVIGGKLNKVGVSNPNLIGNKKPQAQNVSMENQV